MKNLQKKKWLCIRNQNNYLEQITFDADHSDYEYLFLINIRKPIGTLLQFKS